eukprot:TRINITY_DN56294_c0_g1_i1.p1 TRINITY_DN56294_c0_g1~~TRINITY_DN56294_c0_g1_i1.p1  ORF type:complete len:358 (+),score=27.00 TRINITY_DN56294_c0_g1_i1:60-1076(+)
MTITITNRTNLTCRAWVSSRDLFAGSQEAWYKLPQSQPVSWDRSASNKVTIEVSGKEYIHQSSGHSNLVIKDDGIYFDGSKEISFTNSSVLVASSRCDSGVHLTNQTSMRVKAWVSSHDLFAGPQTAWYTIPKGETVHWNRTSNNTVTIEVEGTTYLHQSAGTPGSKLIVKEDGIYFGAKREHVLGFLPMVVVASSPIRGLDGRNYQDILKSLAKKNTNVKVGMDWPGSSTGEMKDVPIFEQMKKAESFEALRTLVKSTAWWYKYVGLVTAYLRVCSFENNNVDCVCIQGGPISQVECSEMKDICEKALHDAKQMRPNANIKINLKVYPDIHKFLASL